jgi:hypothetical protein
MAYADVALKGRRLQDAEEVFTSLVVVVEEEKKRRDKSYDSNNESLTMKMHMKNLVQIIFKQWKTK